MGRHRVVKFVHSWWPLKHEALSGSWEFEWEVTSKNFPKSNKVRVTLYKVLHYIAAEGESRTNSGDKIKYGFVGQIDGLTVTGRWYDARDPGRGYYGTFQVVMGGTMHQAIGKWIGFANDQRVKAGDFNWQKLTNSQQVSVARIE